MSALGCGEHESVSPQCKWGPRTPLRAIGAALPAPALSGFAVVTAAGAAVSAGAKVVGTAVDVAIGAVKATGKAIGSAVDAVSGAGEPDSPPPEPKPSK
jgi:hypothetical protein